MPTEEEEKAAALAAAIAPHPIIAALQAKKILNALVLTGYAGKSDTAGMTRIFRSFGSMSEFTDVATTGFVYAEPGEKKLDPTTFFIAPDALVTHNDGTLSPRPAAEHAQFLRGRIMSQHGTGIPAPLGGITLHVTPKCHEPPPTHPPTHFCPPPPGTTIHTTPRC